MKLDITVASLDAVEERFHDLYSKEGDAYRLTGVKDMKSPSDVANLTAELTKARSALDSLNAKAMPYLELGDLQDITTKLSRVTELEAAGGGKFDESKVAEVAEARVNAIVKPLEATNAKLQQQIADQTAVIKQYESDRKQLTIKTEIDAAIKKAGVAPEFYDTVHLMAEKIFTVNENNKVITKENVGCTPYTEPAVWLAERQSLTPYWWGVSNGGGAMGSNGGNKSVGDNPWSPQTFSMKRQGEILQENRALAVRLAAQHGVTITP